MPILPYTAYQQFMHNNFIELIKCTCLRLSQLSFIVFNFTCFKPNLPVKIF